MIHPQWQFVDDEHPAPSQQYLTAIYPTTVGISQKMWQSWVAQLLNSLEGMRDLELLPANWLERMQLPSFVSAVRRIHHVPVASSDSVIGWVNHNGVLRHDCSAVQRLVVEELLARYLNQVQYRAKLRAMHSQPVLWNEKLEEQLVSSLPFNLTDAQQRAVREIAQDLKQTTPMLRLVQGDVGCGKTIVTIIALAQVAANGYQGALMVPTELLARQHYHNLRGYLMSLGIEVGLLLAGQTSGDKRRTLADIASGKCQVVVGTHALFQERIIFKRLNLVTIDEQQRFGVEQRKLLLDKGVWCDQLPHQLIMTATPIPRTLAMSLYADLDLTVIDELPHGRMAVRTVAISNQRRLELLTRIETVCARGQQVYWVCPLIEENEEANLASVEMVRQLITTALPQFKVVVIHGQLPNSDKERIMQQFLQREIDILVTTTVVEVGVDVPNATVMVIENAERMGLNQLHQLRGRVGRGRYASFCLLLYQTPLSRIAKQRLELICQHHNGWQLAKADLKLRGMGEWFGTKQSGTSGLLIADLVSDSKWLPHVKQLAEQLPSSIQTQLVRRWIGNSNQYGTVA